MIRHGTGVPSGPALICLSSSPKTGKTRLAAAAMRGDPTQFGDRAIYVAIDPEAASLGSILLEDRPHLEVVTLDPKKDAYQELKGILSFDWQKEGIKTVIVDTWTIWAQDMLAALANAGAFSDKHIKLAEGAFQPMPGDFLGMETLTFNLFRIQKASGLNCINIFHEREDRPEPGTPGEPVGGPATVGKAMIRKIAGWHNTALRLEVRPRRRTDLSKPLEYDRILHTDNHGIWQCGLRTPHPTNPIPELVVGADPAETWRIIRRAIEGESFK